eukprot:m.1016971 g.1016971  ORF g.1016971 m.1016971 type:complete len:64 (+) comp24083_c0_seq10:3298-3489(+)
MPLMVTFFDEPLSILSPGNLGFRITRLDLPEVTVGIAEWLPFELEVLPPPRPALGVRFAISVG